MDVWMTNGGKMRIDLLLVERGLAPSRERARAFILAGRVLVREQKVEKPGITVPDDAPIRLLGDNPPYVSRGGLKLAGALEHWQIKVAGRACLDVGASTGGFTDCLLQHGAANVTAVDTGFGQIAMKLRNDPRVRLFERTNARLLEPRALAAEKETPELTLLVMDVSFISATLLLAPVLAAAPGLEEAVILVKPRRINSPSTRLPIVSAPSDGKWWRPFHRRLPAWRATMSSCFTRGVRQARGRPASNRPLIGS
jgi:23S rRNA (cytidine1920-2'-O)/16S rRNA (cytidine1409-2'-O)-methyltransferase